MILSREIDIDRFWKHVPEDQGGCWSWKCNTTPSGYGLLCIWKNNRPNNVFAHRVMWELTNGCDIPKGQYICHHCDNPRCVRPDHLFLGSPSDNIKDCWKKNRHPGNSGGYGKSGIRCVVWDKIHGKWRAQIHRPKNVYLGLHGNLEDARAAVERYYS
jgi:hypothetical protein